MTAWQIVFVYSLFWKSFEKVLTLFLVFLRFSVLFLLFANANCYYFYQLTVITLIPFLNEFQRNTFSPPCTNFIQQIRFATVGSVEDAEMIINHFNDFGSKMKVSYSNKSAKDYNKPTSTSTEDDFYLNLLKEPRSRIVFCFFLLTFHVFNLHVRWIIM